MLLLWLTVPLAVALVVAIVGTHRPGYSPDEEITSLVVDSVAREGVPRLPSGVVYLRGVLYTYLSTLAGAVLGYDIRTYRLVSILFAGTSVLVAFFLGKQLGRPELGFALAAALALSPLHGAAAAVARFYAPFSAAYLVGLLFFVRTLGSRRSRYGFLLALAAARLLHEFAVSLAVLPLIASASRSLDRAQRRRQLVLLGQCAAMMAALQFATEAIQRKSLAAVFSAVPERASFEMTPAFIWPPFQVVAAAPWWSLTAIAVVFALTGYVLAKRMGHAVFAAIVTALAFLFQCGTALVSAVVASLVRPSARARYWAMTAVLAAVAVALWPLHTAWVSGAELNRSFFIGLVSSSFLVPQGGLQHMASVFPLTGLLAALALADTLCRARSTEDVATRVLHAFAVVNVATFSIVDVDFRGRYALLGSPLVLLLAADAVSRCFTILSDTKRRWPVSQVISALVAAAVLSSAAVVERIPAQVGSANPMAAYAAATRAVIPTHIAVPASDIREIVGAGSFVLCNDEAACAYLVGRCDGWIVERLDLFPSAFGRIGGEPYGMYARAPVIQSAQLTEEVHRLRAQGPVVLVVLDTAKFGFGTHVPHVLRLAQEQSGTVFWLAADVLVVRVPKG